MDDHLRMLPQAMEQWNIFLSQESLAKFRRYASLLLEWNERFNLTSITEEKEVVIKHFVDSLSSATVITFSDQAIIDIGTGAGFPGIPLKIVFPELKLTLADSSAKKISFVQTVCRELCLEGCEGIIDNAENIGRDTRYRNTFDLVVTRALSELSPLIEYSIPLLKVQGKLIAYKGPNSQQEVDNSTRALHELKARVSESHDITLPFSDFQRKIIIVEKLGITDSKYPRRVGVPKKRPL